MINTSLVPRPSPSFPSLVGEAGFPLLAVRLTMLQAKEAGRGPGNEARIMANTVTNDNYSQSFAFYIKSTQKQAGTVYQL